MAASPAIKLGEPLEALFRNAGVPDDFYRRYKERLLDMDVGDAGDLLEEVALKGIASLRIQQRQAEKLRRYLLGRRGWGRMQLLFWHPLAACRWTTPLLGWRLATRRLAARLARPLSTAWTSTAATRAPRRMPGLPQVGPQQHQAPRRDLAALTAALVRALLPRAARGRWLAARAAAAHAPQRRRAAPARRGPQLLLAEVDPLCLLTHRILRRRRRVERAAALARCLILDVPTFA